MSRHGLVTGAYGFVGMALCKLLVERGWNVVAAHRRSAAPAAAPGLSSAYLPLSSQPDRWQQALQSIDCVVHLAAHVHQMGRGRDSDPGYQEINVTGSGFVAEQAARAGVKRFVFVSSAKVNGEGSGSRRYRAEDPSEPKDEYARSKLAAEMLIRAICSRTGMEYVIVRPPLVYGPGVRANFRRLLKLADLAWPLPFGSIVNRRSLVGVENLGDFIETCMSHPRAGGRVWMVSDGEDISTPELIRRAAAFMHRPARLFPCPPAALKIVAGLLGRSAEAARLCDSFVLDTRPAAEILEWKPPKSLDEGLALTVADYVAGRRT